MKFHFPLLLSAISLVSVCVRPIEGDDWPCWRGPNHNGIAPAQDFPLKWSDDENVLWKVAVPGRGHGSPIVVGERVVLAAAEPDTGVQSLICFDRDTGKRLWKTEVHRGPFPKKGNKKASLASSTPAWDGERYLINFLHDGAIHTSAVSPMGDVLWQTKISDYVVHQGYGASPLVYDSLVIVSADNKGGGAVKGLDRKSGKIVWEVNRPKTPNYASPIVLHASGRDQCLLTGCDLVTSLDPMSGKKLWEIEGSTTECVTSTVSDGKVMITSGGYPKNHISAVQTDGSGTIAWEIKNRVYVPSMIIGNGTLYGVMDAGIAGCWDVSTGEELWKSRLGGTFSSSVVMVGDKLLATNEKGETFVFKAQRHAFELLEKNVLGNDVFATPTVSGGRIYHRMAERKDGRRQEYLCCIGKK